MKTSKVNARNADIGGDGDIEGIAQTIGPAVIEAVLMSEAPTADRLAALQGMKRELEARSHADFGDDLAVLIADVDHAIMVLHDKVPSSVDSSVKTF